WLKISPEAGYLVSAMDQYMYIFMVVILLALCFGIINTMLMVIMERVRELGMLMAIGMNKLKVFMMIMLETVFLSLTGGVLGIVGGYFVTRYFEHAGINLYFWKEAFASMGYSAMVYPVIEPGTMIIVTIMVIVTGIFSSLYPAYKALKLNPSQAIRS
ncbi:MAG: FtsX-like permease family protein, partial [Bacteroidales bacterium]|nr:FtsX-like permease family protein [Bacteroidales bacterium]